MSLLGRPEFWVVIVYLILMLVAGVAVLRQNHGGQDFFAGGRAIPWWASGISLYMANFSAWMFTGGAGMIYRSSGYGIVYFFIIGSVSYLLGSQISAAAWRRSRALSPVELTRQRFSVATQQVLSVLTSFIFLAAAGNQLRAIATVVTASLDVPIEAAAIVIGGVVIAYTLIGGLWAVTLTDLVQVAILLGVTLLVAPLSLALLPQGFGDLLSGLEFSITPRAGEAPGQDLHFLIAALISASLGVAANSGPSFYCVPDERSARRAGALAAVLFLTTPLLFSIPTLVGRAVWGGPEQLGAVIAGPDPHERVYVEMTRKVLPEGLIGLFLAAMFSATMSTLCSVYNRVAAVFTMDLWKPFWPAADDRALIFVGRWMTLVCGLVTIGLCLFYIHWEGDLFQVMTTIFFAALPVTAVPVVFALFFRDAPRGAGMMCIVWGLGTAAMTHALHWPVGPHIYLTESVCLGAFFVSPWLRRTWREPSGAMTIALCGFILATLAFGIASSLGPAPAAGAAASAWIWKSGWAVFLAVTLPLFARRFAGEGPSPELDRFHERLDTPVRKDEVTGSPQAVIDLYRLTGWITAVVAGMVLVLYAIDALDSAGGETRALPYFALFGLLAAFAAAFLIAARRDAAGKTLP